MQGIEKPKQEVPYLRYREERLVGWQMDYIYDWNCSLNFHWLSDQLITLVKQIVGLIELRNNSFSQKSLNPPHLSPT